MASFLERAGAGVALAGLMLSGCYSSRPLDEELPDEPARADAGVVPQDAAPAVDATAARCSGDPITLLLCQLTPPTQPAQPQTGLPDLTTLLGSLGGLANIAEILGPVVGTTRPGTPVQETGGLVDLVNLAGGLANIAQLFNQLLGGQSALPTLFTGAQQGQPTPTLADFLKGLGIPVAGDPVPLTQEPSADDCAKPATPAQQFACALQQTL